MIRTGQQNAGHQGITFALRQSHYPHLYHGVSNTPFPCPHPSPLITLLQVPQSHFALPFTSATSCGIIELRGVSPFGSVLPQIQLSVSMRLIVPHIAPDNVAARQTRCVMGLSWALESQGVLHFQQFLFIVSISGGGGGKSRVLRCHSGGSPALLRSRLRRMRIPRSEDYE
jgi:hypothetical protein